MSPKKGSKQLPLPEYVPVENLRLDPLNPRVLAAGVGSDHRAILRLLWRDYSVDEVAYSIANNGFFTHEPIFADKKGVVLEGNRRLAAVSLLLDEDLRRQVGATELPRISSSAKEALKELPVIRCAREEIWQYTGYKHINGPQPWSADAKSEYIAWVHDEVGIPLDEIAATIGDRHQTVQRMYHARRVLDQAKDAQVYDLEDRYKKHFSFSHLYTGLGYGGIQKFLGIRDSDYEKNRPVPRNKQKELGELLLWMYGSKSQDVAPLVKSQNPDLRKLDEVVQTDEGVTAIRRGLSLDAAVDVSRGDERIFREALQAAKQSLQVAVGTALTGYGGDAALLNTAKESAELAQKLVEDMQTKSEDRRRRRGRD